MGMLERVSEELRHRILSEVGYSEDSLAEDMKRFKLWMKGQPHLPPSATSEPDCFLENFLVGCKGDFSLAKEKLDSYYSARSRMPNIHKDRDPTTLFSSKDSLKMSTLRRTTEDGWRISIVAMKDDDLAKWDFHMFLKRFMAVVELRMRSDGLLAGDWVVIDGRGITWAHVIKLDPSDIKDFIQLVQNILPARIKGILFINAPSFTEKFLNLLVKPFLKKKLANRIFIYSDGYKTLLKHLPKNIVPKEFGGEGEDFSKSSDLWLEEAESKKDWFMGSLSETTDESQRLGEGGCSMDIVHGSFRKLDID